jgi:phenylpropionate dioxygenase-like ring-hydroxylating dioxygenase large terminal subunit
LSCATRKTPSTCWKTVAGTVALPCAKSTRATPPVSPARTTAGPTVWTASCALPYPDGYEGILEKSDLPLTSLRVESYAGMIFASYNEQIEPLEDFLGGAKHWMDLFMKQGAGYPIKTQGEHKFSFKGNWKIQLENTTDGYHFPIVHKSFMSSVDEETSEMLSFMTDEQAVTTPWATVTV